MSTVPAFISRFCQWAGANGYPQGAQRKLPAALRLAVQEELPSRDQAAWVVARTLTESEGLRWTYQSKHTLVVPTSEPTLVCVVIMPSWRNGWGHISRDQFVAEDVDLFFHLASQYVARGRLTNALGSLALVYGRGCGFLGGPMSMQWLPDARDHRLLEKAMDELVLQHASIGPRPDSSTSPRQRQLALWMDAINSLDPFVHRAVYQYVRACQLHRHGFFEEAITDLDSAMDVSAQFVRDRVRQRADDQRERSYEVFGLHADDRAQLRLLQRLRNHFGAHPSATKWWDFSELYEVEIEQFFDVLRRVLWRLCVFEQRLRLVEPVPTSWSAWFRQNALMVWDAVWFGQIPAS